MMYDMLERVVTAMQDANKHTSQKIMFSLDARQDGEAPKLHDHYHNSFEVYYLQKGTCWYFIDKKSYRLTAGDIALIPAGVIHKTSYETPLSSRTVFNCDTSLIPESTRLLMEKTPYFARTNATEGLVKEIFQSICREYRTQDMYSDDIIRTKVAQLFLLIARESSHPQEEKQESPIVEKAADYIRKHYMEPVSLQAVAKHCFVSREHLSRIFKKETGFGFNEYLNIYRLKKANAVLLEDPKQKISDVALRCGFNDSNYFSKQYRRMFGVAPTKSRKKE